jgi:hypothetical protein
MRVIMCSVPLFIILVPLVVVLSPLGLPFFLGVLGYWFWDTRRKQRELRQVAGEIRNAPSDAPTGRGDEPTA